MDTPIHTRIERAGKTEGRTKKTKLTPSAGKVMASVFWYAKRILFVEFVYKDKIITEEH